MQIAGSDIENQVSRLVAQYLNERPDFASWYWQKAREQGCCIPATAAIRAEVSYKRNHARGQTDVGLVSPAVRAVILTENKIIHHLDKDQRDRYRQECEGLISEGWAAAIVLIAPERYLKSIGAAAGDFDACISYEAMNEQLGGDDLILRAIDRCERGYLAQGIPEVSSNFDGYTQLVRQAFPELRLLTKAGNNPTQSRTTQFDSDFAVNNPPGVPYVWLLHQWQQGASKLLFKNWAQHRQKLTSIVMNDVQGHGFVIDPGTPKVKSFGFMKRTPVVDNHAPFKKNADAFFEGLVAIKELRAWYLTHTEVVARWVDAVS